MEDLDSDSNQYVYFKRSEYGKYRHSLYLGSSILHKDIGDAFLRFLRLRL